MRRREFILAVSATAASPASALTPSEDSDARAVRKAICDWTAAFDDRSVSRSDYAAFMAPDYEAIEGGVKLDRAAELRARAALPAAFRRTPSCDFRKVDVRGSTAAVDLIVDAEIADGKHGVRRRRWQGQIALRCEGERWLVAKLRSDPIREVG